MSKLKIIVVCLSTLIASGCSHVDDQIRTENCLSAYDQADYETAFKNCNIYAKQNDTPSIFTLAMMYTFGNGVAENMDEAERLYKLAMREDKGRTQSYAMSAMNLAYIYDKRNQYDDRNKYLELAIKEKSPRAMSTYGGLYIDGNNVETDYIKGLYWVKKAALSSDPDEKLMFMDRLMRAEAIVMENAGPAVIVAVDNILKEEEKSLKKERKEQELMQARADYRAARNQEGWEYLNNSLLNAGKTISNIPR